MSDSGFDQRGNRDRVSSFCDELLKAAPPTIITVGGRTYEILPFLKEGDGNSVKGAVMVERAKGNEGQYWSGGW